MATKNYTTKTASLRATKADIGNLDTKKLFIDGVNITDLIKSGQVTILDDRGTLANDELDIWMSNVSTDEDGNVIVREYPQKFEIAIDDMTETQKSTLKSAVKVENNQVLGADDAHLMFFETNALTKGNYMFYGCTALTTFDSDLSSLTDSSYMFVGTALTSFSGDLSSLVNGNRMFRKTSLTSFSEDLSNLTDGSYMFYQTSLESFSGDLSSLTNGSSMFSGTALTSFSGDLSSLTNGRSMFYNCTNLTTFNGDLSSLTDGDSMFYTCTNLTTFNGDLSSLNGAYGMFSDCKLDASSLANIIHTIKDRTGLSTPSFNAGLIYIGLGIDDTDEARQALAEAIWSKDWNDVNQEFTDKNWTVQWQFNGAPTSATLNMNTTTSPIWAKLEEVVADENGNIPHYSYVSEDGSKYFNLYWYHSSNGNNDGYDYFGSLLEACGYFGIVPKEYANEA